MSTIIFSPKRLLLAAALVCTACGETGSEATLISQVTPGVDCAVTGRALSEPMPRAAGLQPGFVRPWAGGVMPLYVPPSFSDKYKQRIFAACQEWTDAAGIRCVEWNHSDPVYAQITDDGSGSCYSGVGSPDPQWPQALNINVGETSCGSYSTLLHELGHAIGLMHEHQRPAGVGRGRGRRHCRAPGVDLGALNESVHEAKLSCRGQQAAHDLRAAGARSIALAFAQNLDAVDEAEPLRHGGQPRLLFGVVGPAEQVHL